ncbi:hypothetical protein GCM10011415_02750 [Salipiger pallidus]|uniref:Uncharacterized protein n=1 Tax=Salipiger pallidus TaxID=1775170 RepID=A0A8J2ZGG4_9RHOB|nr:hypothetical protein [Salipiger pallidus]GGG60287.1 hypothetical protein GCM10011415_02750 [Salipiger pallidus]
MTHAGWTLLEAQGAREVWQLELRSFPDKVDYRFRGEEYTELDGERTKVEETREFDTQTEALAWLTGETG